MKGVIWKHFKNYSITFLRKVSLEKMIFFDFIEIFRVYIFLHLNSIYTAETSLRSYAGMSKIVPLIATTSVITKLHGRLGN